MHGHSLEENEMVKTDIEIAQANTLEPMGKVAQAIGLSESHLEMYGDNKAKLKQEVLAEKGEEVDGKLVLVTAMNPTPAGEGKTTTSIGIADAMRQEGHQAALALREPSLGPVFGMKGGAAGGGYAQVVPMEDLNLHFTGDLHAIAAANNLLAAMIDNHIYQGNRLNIDSRRVLWRRVMDMNDRQLRQIVSGLGSLTNGVPREDGFDITAASEIMAILCLAEDYADLRQRLGDILIAYDDDGEPVKAREIKAEGALLALLKDAFKPNLVQTLEGTPALIHGGPFANIAHGCNSVVATKTALKHADYVITEAGFGADLGAEKFFDIKCRQAGLEPDAVVIVGTIRSLKYNGGVAVKDLNEENVPALEAGLPNLIQHIQNMQEVFGLKPIVAINQFPSDSQAEFDRLEELLKDQDVEVYASNVWAEGGKGAIDLAQAIVRQCEEEEDFRFAYDLEDSIQEKVEKIAKTIYRADGVEWTPAAKKKIRQFEEQGYGHLPVCVAKTQYSFSDKASLKAAPRDFTITIRDAVISAGAGFIVVLAGNVMRMPGLPKKPAAEEVDMDQNGRIIGLF